MFTLRFLRRVLLTAVFMWCSATVKAEDIRLAGMRLGSAWYVFSATLYKLMLDKLPDGTRLEVMSKGGGIANPLLVESGKVQVALANRATAVWAHQGNALVYGDKKCPNLRVLVGGLNTVPASFIVRNEYIKRTGNNTIEKVLTSDKPVRIVMKPRGSSAPVVADLTLAAMGTSRKKILANGGRILQVASKQIPNIMRNRQADVYIELAPLGQQIITEISYTVPVTFFDFPEALREKLAAKGLRAVEIPEFWKGQSGPTKTVDIGTVIIARHDLSEDLAYQITKTICENKETLAKAHKAWKKFEPEVAGTLDSSGIPLHPGAARYYKERGWKTE